MTKGWIFRTRRGPVYIVPHQTPSGVRFQIVYNDEGLGSYATPRQAADDAAGGHTFSPSNGVDLGSLGIPDNIGEWETF